MTPLQVYALGNFLATYSSDLTYISNFQQLKNEGFVKKQSWVKDEGTFKSFLDEYRVTRNIRSVEMDKFWEVTCDWLMREKHDNVDGLAKQLKSKGAARGIVTSLASKILFLNSPRHVLPMDKWVKAAVGYKGNEYNGYVPLANQFATDNKDEIEACLNSISEHIHVVEVRFKGNLSNIAIIRKNRFVDKLLWAKGFKAGK